MDDDSLHSLGRDGMDDAHGVRPIPFAGVRARTHNRVPIVCGRFSAAELVAVRLESHYLKDVGEK